MQICFEIRMTVAASTAINGDVMSASAAQRRERQLLRAARRGDAEARRRLVETYLPLVRRVAAGDGLAGDFRQPHPARGRAAHDRLTVEAAAPAVSA